MKDLQSMLNVIPTLPNTKKIQNDILKALALHDSIGEIKLYEIVAGTESPEGTLDFNQALYKLSSKGIIDIVYGKDNDCKFIRLKKVLH